MRSFLLITLIFYGGWWSVVFLTSHDHPILPLGVVSLCIVANVLITGWSIREWLWIIVGTTLGFAFDSTIQSSGLLTFSHRFHPLLAPLWIAGLWALFSSSFLTLKNFKKLPIQIFFGAIGGPLSYLAGTKFDLVVYTQPQGLSLVLHSLLWGLFFPILMRVHQILLQKKEIHHP